MLPWYSLSWFSPAQWQQYHIVHPLALSLIPAILLLFLLRFYLHRRGEQRLNISFGTGGDGSGHRRAVRRSRLSLLRYLLPISMFLAMALLLIALARPQVVRTQREEQSAGIDIVLAIDVSESMSEADVPPTRLAAARRVAQRFVNSRKNDRIGLVIFAGEAFSLCPLTTDYALIKQYLDELNVRMIRTSGTAIGDALARCINRMREPITRQIDTTRRAEKERNPPNKVIILLSDGDNTAGNLDPITAARLAKAFSIRIYTIALGKLQTAANGVATVDEGILKTIATTANGSFFRATDAQRLRAVFAQINQLEKAPIQVQVYQDVQDYYRVYLNWSIVFLLLTLLLKSTIFGNILED